MALKNKLDKAAFDALPDALKEHYKEVNGAYVLDAEDAREAIAARDREKQRADELQAQIDAANAATTAAQEAARVAAEEAARKKGDVTALEASWQQKFDTQKTTYDAALAAANETIHTLLVKNVAADICNEVSVAPKLLLDYVMKRLKVEGTGAEALTRVLDEAGKPSALSLEEFKQELLANKEFAAIIKGANSSGGGATGNGNGGAGSKQISQMTEAERIAHAKSVGAVEFERQVAAEKAA